MITIMSQPDMPFVTGVTETWMHAFQPREEAVVKNTTDFSMHEYFLLGRSDTQKSELLAQAEQGLYLGLKLPWKAA